MECPHCGGSISHFSREMNRFSKNKKCPHCKKPVRLFLNFNIAALLLIPLGVLTFLLKPVFMSWGISDSISTGLLTGLLIILSMRLEAG